MDNKDRPYWEKSKDLSFDLNNNELEFAENFRNSLDFQSGSFINPKVVSNNRWSVGVDVYEEYIFDDRRASLIELCSCIGIKKLYSIPAHYGESEESRTFFKDSFSPPLACSFSATLLGFSDFYDANKSQVHLHPHYIFPFEGSFVFFSTHIWNYSLFAGDADFVEKFLGVDARTSWNLVTQNKGIESWRYPTFERAARAYGIF